MNKGAIYLTLINMFIVFGTQIFKEFTFGKLGFIFIDETMISLLFVGTICLLIMEDKWKK